MLVVEVFAVYVEEHPVCVLWNMPVRVKAFAINPLFSLPVSQVASRVASIEVVIPRQGMQD